MRRRAIDASKESVGSRGRGTLDPAAPLESDGSQLEAVVHHDGRLNILCCLLDEGPLSPFQVAVRIGESAQTVRYWAKLLDTFDLIEQRGSFDDGEPRYAATLHDHPGWVQEAVRQHRPRSLDGAEEA